MKKKPKLGLALGAGSARGFAHVGVLEVLQANGIEADYVAGCSMGAFIGALYATGSDLALFQKLIPVFGVKKLMDFSLTRHGLIKGEKIEELVRVLTKNRNIEETDIPFRAVAVELCSGKAKVFESGPIYKAVRASISIPGIFIPYEYEGKIYVDGGLVERLPVQTAKEMGADIVIGVDVAYKGETQKQPGSVMETMAQIMNVMSWEIAKKKIYEADILILPKVRHVNAYSSDQAEACIELGREAAMQALPEIKKLLDGETAEAIEGEV